MSAAIDRALPDAKAEPTIEVERAGRCLNISRASAYAAVQRGEIPSIRVGRRILVPTSLFLSKYFGAVA